jgi:hypothetical protein
VPWILDGNNLAGGSDRPRVRRAALALARQEKLTLLVFFDGAPPAGTPDTERLGRVEVRYVPDADAAILALVRQRGEWVLSTDDRELRERARGLGVRPLDGASFWRRARRAEQSMAVHGTAQVDVEAEMAYFGDDSRRLPTGPGRYTSRSAKKRHRRRR